MDDHHLYYLDLQPTPTLTVTLNSIGFHNYEALVTVFCMLSKEKYQDWQLKTFNSIMNAYDDLKSSYDQAVQEARLQAGTITISGTNPSNNRITEQTELKIRMYRTPDWTALRALRCRRAQRPALWLS